MIETDGEVTHSYTPEQASWLLVTINVRYPGILDWAEAQLKQHNLWPEDEEAA